MSYSLSYRSSRAEVWHWYWAAWRARLWREHLLVAAILALVLPYFSGVPYTIKANVLCFIGALPAVTVLFALWPQIMFKSRERTLHVGPDGWSTNIGSTSGSRRWAEIASIQEALDYVVITSATGNALIVPARAFADEAIKSQFVKDARAWLHGQAVRNPGHTQARMITTSKRLLWWLLLVQVLPLIVILLGAIGTLDPLGDFASRYIYPLAPGKGPGVAIRVTDFVIAYWFVGCVAITWLGIAAAIIVVACDSTQTRITRLVWVLAFGVGQSITVVLYCVLGLLVRNARSTSTSA
jgi:hypothetical protein